ncbi:Pathogenicity island protein [Bacillus velezensis]|uniref:Pathogenicity island protein n=1 Tax=Bacillus amyloliquefaciens group TaxID=1938374 RepID=UPI0008F8D923|nr:MULTISPECIES: Pathogenicity island protein [Bacillus amyloliquefaciens group]MBI0441466.1 Pathogenicity island protein [Bacillus velezensis]NIH00492.1 Pathogenicity island protein [Bacillus amyloliquefaciens]QKF35402.1 Pathogenicity island protein [Bacillus velezensis]
MQSKMKLTAVKLAALVFLVGAFALPVLPHAAAAAESQATYKVENLNDSELKMTFNHADVHIDAKGNAILKDNITGEEQALPKSSADKNGDPVKLKYEKIKNGVLVKVVNKDSGKTSGSISTQSVGKCILGTGGGAVTGGGTLGLAGAAVGTVTIPGIGTVGAGAVGAITGAVGGAMTGAAASCF